MAQSLANVVLHIIYSTKNRTPYLKDRSQEHRHQRMTFQDEFREICQRHGIAIDERCVWD